ncbi:MAG: DEAD/DEAH box helicase, partial [Deltaproteobacteria bacterium]|nr:DEAD/DEAH box helicase [Deltaproteobacteria bacterium]
MTTNTVPPDGAGEDQPEIATIPSWEQLGISDEIGQALSDLGYLQPMPVQAAVYEHVRAGRDMMVQAQTGTGKTAAFGIPTVEAADDSPGVKTIILTPTRELALQVHEELRRIASFKPVTVVPIYGGAPIRKQIDQLAAGAQVVAGTPGRVLDHIRRKTLDTSTIKMLILDECDEMLSMGFQEEIENIISHLPGKEDRQTLLFSATIPGSIERIAAKHLTDPEKIELSEGGISVAEIDHGYYIVSGMARMRDLLKVLTYENPESAIIFCNTRDETSSVAKFLNRHGLDAEHISSDLSQKDRERVMKRMRDKNLRFLVATDVAARGIDISDLPYVINYTFPESAEVYVHRTGRTGRAGNRGIALSLVGPREIGSFYYLKLLYKIQPEERDLPGNEVIAAALEGEKVKKIASQVKEDAGEEYRRLARRLWESEDGERVVAFLLKNHLTGALRSSGARR